MLVKRENKIHSLFSFLRPPAFWVENFSAYACICFGTRSRERTEMVWGQLSAYIVEDHDTM